MSYHDTRCPCGGKKPTDTMLCDNCNQRLSERREMAIFRNEKEDQSYRRHAAIILLSLARRLGRAA